jgi:hypothetical protein
MSSIFSTSSDVKTETRQHLFLIFHHSRRNSHEITENGVRGNAYNRNHGGTGPGSGDTGSTACCWGRGSGALVGQAIGRDHEATLIGTAVGGMFGYIVGNEMNKDRYGRVHVAPQPVVYAPPPPPKVL